MVVPDRIEFEDEAAATAPAHVVLVSDQLSNDLDWTTFELTEIEFGDRRIAVPEGLQYFGTTVSVSYEGVDFEAQIRGR